MAAKTTDLSKQKNAVVFNDDDSDHTIIGSNYNDTLDGKGGNDILAGGNGNDIIHGGTGNDQIWGDSLGNASLANDNGQDFLFGDEGSDELHGGNAKDVLDGGSGNDVFFGDNGSDALTGGLGDDVLVGGNGPDTFIYKALIDSEYHQGGPGAVTTAWTAGAGSAWGIAADANINPWDVITDFEHGTDKIDLTALNPTTGPLTRLTWTDSTESDAASGGANPNFADRVWSDDTGNFIYADTNGDGIADLKIQVHGVGSGDFIGVNHVPTPHADDNASDSVVEAGVVNPGNTLFAGDDTAVGNVLTNDTDPDGDALTVVAARAGNVPGVDIVVPTDNSDASIEGTYGTLVIHKDGTYTYTLNNSDSDTNALAQDEAAQDVFTYTISDPFHAQSSTTLSINIIGSNDAPTAFADSTSTDEDTAINITVLANDTDPDHNHVLSVGTFDPTSTDGATVSLNGNGTLHYDPTVALNHLRQGASVDDTFSYTVADEHGATSMTTVTVHVTGVNDSPTAVVDNAITNEDTAVDINVVANDTDPDDGAVLSVAGFDFFSANGATISLNGDGTLQYDPTSSAIIDALNNGDSLNDTFNYTVKDENGATSSATVTVHVDGVPNHDPDPPPAGEVGFTLLQNGNELAHLGRFVADVGANAHFTVAASSLDPDTDPSVITADNGVLSANGAGAGTFSLQVTATGDGGSATSTYTLWIGTSDADSQTFALASGNNIGIGLQANDAIVGSNGIDFLMGSSANDHLTGNGGADQLQGGNGNDTFVYAAAADSTVGSHDVIFDFIHGKDTVDLSAIGGITNVQGLINSADQVSANSVAWYVSDNGTTTTVVANTSAVAETTASADMDILLLGTPALTQNDFHLV
jgi:VCBS repeat-containing protein